MGINLLTIYCISTGHFAMRKTVKEFLLTHGEKEIRIQFFENGYKGGVGSVAPLHYCT